MLGPLSSGLAKSFVTSSVRPTRAPHVVRPSRRSKPRRPRAAFSDHAQPAFA
jgi:hypothetical protein